jgi:hypothetical protein
MSRSMSRLKSISGLGRLHMRLGSKDMSERSASGSGDRDSAETEAQTTMASPLPRTTPLPQMQQAVIHGDGRPGPRPVPFSPRQGSWLRGVDSSETESSMLAFTPLSPRTVGDGPGPSLLGNGNGNGNGNGMSSSGSTLILQK